ncbi:MAG TPA: dihydrofolate reductase family protein [bacterium]|jgi:dihydrofolate reductase|nr:dihydrofolate reductase family protein [bacterium]
MRKIIMFNLVSVDGFFAGPDGNIDWHVVDDEFNKAAVEMIKPFDTIVFGRVTYQLFESYWPNAAKDPATSKEDRIIANKINEMNKIVFSKTLTGVQWENARLLKEIVPEELARMKQESGKDMVIYGSGTIVRQLTNLGLVDEYRVLVNPVVLGKGKPLFTDVNRVNLRLVGTKTFSSGNVLLDYQPT